MRAPLATPLTEAHQLASRAQAVGPSDLRAALDRALRNLFVTTDGADVPKGYGDARRTQLLQHVHRANLLRLLGGVTCGTYASAAASCATVPPPRNSDAIEKEIGKLGKHADKELLDTYTKGLFGPKVRHVTSRHGCTRLWWCSSG